SIYARDILALREGAPPAVDLAAERRNGDFVRGEIRSGTLSAVHDVSDGGIAATVAEMAIASGIGARIEPPADLPLHAWAFAEDQARYVVTLPEADADAMLARAAAAGVPAARIG